MKNFAEISQRPYNLGELICSSFSFYFRNFIHFFIPYILLFSAQSGVNISIYRHYIYPGIEKLGADFNVLTFLGQQLFIITALLTINVLFFICSRYVSLYVTNRSSEIILGEDRNETGSKALACLPGFIFTNLLVHILNGAAWSIGGLPGLAMKLVFQRCYVPIVAIKKKFHIHAIKEMFSIQFQKDNGLNTLGFSFVMNILSGMIASLLSIIWLIILWSNVILYFIDESMSNFDFWNFNWFQQFYKSGSFTLWIILSIVILAFSRSFYHVQNTVLYINYAYNSDRPVKEETGKE